MCRNLKKPVVALNGGLGNQLFQWFFAHTLIENGPFVLDLLFEKEDPLRQRGFQLDGLVRNCEHVAKEKDGAIAKFKFGIVTHFFNHLWLIAFFRSPLTWLGYYRENPIKSVAQSPRVPNPVRYAYGYFQKQQIIDGLNETVERELLPVVQSLLPDLLKKYNLNFPYTAIHFRHYLTEGLKLTPVHFCNLSLQYFTEWNAANSGQEIVLLTDQVADVVDLIELLQPKLVLDREQTTAWETLALMSGATRFLGANSSLSWWGARLSSAQGGEVWLPSDWSYWENVNPKDFHFESCNTAKAYWDISGFQSPS